VSYVECGRVVVVVVAVMAVAVMVAVVVVVVVVVNEGRLLISNLKEDTTCWSLISFIDSSFISNHGL
jgi:hypothetical protein